MSERSELMHSLYTLYFQSLTLLYSVMNLYLDVVEELKAQLSKLATSFKEPVKTTKAPTRAEEKVNSSNFNVIGFKYQVLT